MYFKKINIQTENKIKLFAMRFVGNPTFEELYDRI
jgi:hypothetical protein